MTALNSSHKAFVTVSEMADLCSISRSSFYRHLGAGVFPKPVQHPSSKRPMYDRTLQEKCLEIVLTGIGVSGQPILFNRKSKKPTTTLNHRKNEKKADHADLLAALKGLGLSTSTQAVEKAVAELFPLGYEALDQGDVVRKVFLFLQGGKK